MSDDSSTTPPAGHAIPGPSAYGQPQQYPGAPAQPYSGSQGHPVAPAHSVQPQPAAPYGAAQQQPYAAQQQAYAAQQQPYAAQQPHPYAQPYAPAQPYAAPLPTSGLAVASLITGIAGIVLSFAVFPLLASLAAIITGHMALKQTRPGSALGGRGMAIAGLILGYVGVAILALVVIVSVFSFLFIGSIGFLPFLLA